MINKNYATKIETTNILYLLRYKSYKESKDIVLMYTELRARQYKII